MGNNTTNTKAIDSLKKILVTSSQYNFEKELIDENNVEQYAQAYYSDLETNETSRLKLKDLVNKFAQTLNVDLNDGRIAVSFATIDATFDNSSLDGLIESVNKKMEFIEDMSYQMNNNKEAKTQVEDKVIEDNINLENEGKPFDLVQTAIVRTKDAALSIKNFLGKQTERISSFFINKEKIKEIGNKVLEKIGMKQKELDVPDKSTLFIEHLLKIKELRDAGVEFNDDIASKILDPNFDKEAIIKDFLNNPEIDKIKPEEVSTENSKDEDIKLDEKTKIEEIKPKDVTIIADDNIKIYKKDADGKCFSAINHNGKPWGNYQESSIEEFNKIVENSISKEYDKISNVVKNPKGEILGVSETFTLYSEDKDGNKISGMIYSKDINGNYTVGLDYNGNQWGPRTLSQEEYNKALSKHLSLTNDASADYLKDANLNDLVDKFNKEQIEKEEIAKTEAIKEEVFKDEVIKDEVVKDEVAKEEIIKEEVVKDEVAKEEIIKEEVVKDEAVYGEKETSFDYYSVDSFSVKQGNTMHKYFKNEKGEMFRQFVFNGLEGSPQPIKDTLDWENAIKESVEYSAEFNDIEMEAQELNEQSIEVESKENTNEDIEHEEDFFRF